MVGMGRRQGGASLVEVLVVIGILAIAILAFIRLYPSGFLALKRSGQSDAATRYAQQELERLKARADNLPRAIVPIRYVREGDTPALIVDASVSPDDLSQQPDLPQGVPALYASGVNRFRRIVGEHVSLGLPGPLLGSRNQLTEGIAYTTLFAPIAQPPANRPLDEYLSLTGAPMRRLILNSDFQQPNIRLYEYGIDYDAAKVLLRPLRDERIEYQVEYSIVYQSGSRVETLVVTEVIELLPTDPPEPEWRALRLADLPRGRVLGIVPYSDTVARRFIRLEPNAPWSPVNPYQYKVLNLLTGTILINPLASGYYERYWRGTRPLEAYVSYYVHDWTIMREEFTVPNSGRIRLAFSDLKQVGDLQDDQTKYEGLGLGLDERGQLQADLIIVDLLTGRTAYFQQGRQILDDELATPLRAQTLPNLNATIDYATGNLQIGNPQMQGRKIRVFYKVHENWAISVQKAANRYYLVQNRAAMTYDTCWYDLGAVLDRELTESARRLYFTRSEAGKTILLREYWYDVDDDPDNGNTQRGTNGVFRISETPDARGWSTSTCAMCIRTLCAGIPALRGKPCAACRGCRSKCA
jgi:type II secretory pathway pseudopilin PulG